MTPYSPRPRHSARLLGQSQSIGYSPVRQRPDWNYPWKTFLRHALIGAQWQLLSLGESVHTRLRVRCCRPRLFFVLVCAPVSMCERPLPPTASCAFHPPDHCCYSTSNFSSSTSMIAPARHQLTLPELPELEFARLETLRRPLRCESDDQHGRHCAHVRSVGCSGTAAARSMATPLQLHGQPGVFSPHAGHQRRSLTAASHGGSQVANSYDRQAATSTKRSLVVS